jgi:hypothetical protein
MVALKSEVASVTSGFSLAFSLFELTFEML